MRKPEADMGETCADNPDHSPLALPDTGSVIRSPSAVVTSGFSRLAQQRMSSDDTHGSRCSLLDPGQARSAGCHTAHPQQVGDGFQVFGGYAVLLDEKIR